jgi:predicted O-methyltransferase YrrM
MEDYAKKHDFPIIGPACGYYCYQLARMTKAKSVFELGSGYGYSTAWFAKAVRENGGRCAPHRLGRETAKMASSHLLKLIRGQISQCREVETSSNRWPVDIIFNDIDMMLSRLFARDQREIAQRRIIDH